MIELPLPLVPARYIRRFLRVEGWEPSDKNAWHRDLDGDTFEVVVPDRSSAPDYQRRLQELIDTTSAVTDEPPDRVLDRLLAVSDDVHYIGLQPAGLRPGIVPLLDVAAAARGAFDMIAASAASADQPRLVHPSRLSERAANVAKAALLSLPKPGSFLLPIHLRLPPRLTPDEGDQVLFDDVDLPIERRTSIMCQRAVSTLYTIARAATMDDAVDLSRFEQHASDGLSANLCEALVKISGPNRSPFYVDFAWAIERPHPRSGAVLAFDSAMIEIIEVAARGIRQSTEEDGVAVSGFITRLHRESQLGPGDVTIAGSTDDPDVLHKYHVNLAESDYEDAINAHQRGLPVMVSGAVRRVGNRRQLVNHTGLHLNSAQSIYD